jgi:protein-S-isoprenylcysteine O-methyltransferase Ste14
MGAALGVLYGVICYAIFLVTFLYAIGFTGNLVVPKSIDSGAVVGKTEAINVNLFILTVFALQHTIKARPGFKAVWTRIVPKSIERSTYVLLSNAALILIYWQWRPMPDVVWDVSGSLAGEVLNGVFWFGWLFVLLSTFMIDHFELFGIKQVLHRMKNKEALSMTFKMPLFYKFVRHPIMLGFIIAFWATPTMTQGHLLFAAVTTAYIFVALQFEERDLIAELGEDYIIYKSKVSMILPLRRHKD